MARFERALEDSQLCGDRRRLGAAEANDADSTTAWRGGDGHNRVSGRKHVWLRTSGETLGPDAKSPTPDDGGPRSSLPRRNMDRLGKCVADALRRDAGNLGDRHVHDATFVGIEGAKLLIE